MAMTTEERFESIEKRLDGFEERLSRIEELLRDRQKAQDEDEKEQIQNRQQAADHEKDDTAPATEKNGLAKNQGQERQDEAGKTSPEPTQKQPQPDNGFFDAEEKRLDEIAKEFNANLQKMRDDLAKRRAAAEQAPEEEKKGLLGRFSDWMHNIYQNNVNELRKIFGMQPLEEKKEPENRTAAETVVNQQSLDKDAEIERLKKLVDDLKAKLKQQDKEPEKSSEKTPDQHEQKPVEDRTGKTPGSVKESAEPEITSENKGPSKTESEVKNQEPQSPQWIEPDMEPQDNAPANNIVTGGHLVPLADASNVADEFKNVVNSKELMTPTGFETAFVYTALKNDEFNSNFVPAFNKMREEDRNWDNPERTNLECIVDLAQIALNESLRHDSTAVLCQGAGNTECFAYPKDQFNFDFSNSITLRDMTLSIARENGEILHLSEEEAHNLSKMHLNDLREKLPESIQMAQYIGEVLEEMDISLKKGIKLQPADLREAIKSNASEVINSFEQEGMNRQQAINATYNGYLKKLKYDASTM
jgi:hypothetical protein